MAVTITDLRTTGNQADATTGWVGSTTLFTADPDPVEATGCLGAVVSTATVDCYPTQTAVNLSNKLVYVWVNAKGAMDSRAAGGIGLTLGDGTNRVSFHLAGADVSAFRHDTGPVEWQCLLLDTSALPATSTVRAGTLGGLNLAAITQIGATFKTLQKSKGGVANCFIDISRFGDPTLNDGAMIRVAGGTVGDPGTFSQIALADRGIANLQAYGVVREPFAGAVGVQGALQFGTPTGTTSSVFVDTDTSITFESRGLLTTRYGIIIRDNGVGTTTFRLGIKVGTGTAANGSNGCSIVAASGVGAFWDSKTDTNVDTVFLYGSTFSGFTGGFRMRTGQEMAGSTIAASGLIEPTGANIYNSTIIGSTATQAMTIDSVAQMNNVVGCTFTNNNRAIRITAPGTYTFDRLLFSGNTFDVENSSAGLVTINAVNGSNVTTSINTGGGSTVIVNAKSFTVTNVLIDSEVRIIRQSDLVELGGAENVSGSPTGVNNVAVSADADNPGRYKVVYSYGYTADIPIFVIVFNVERLPIRIPSTLRSTDGSLSVFQITDRQYDRGTTFSPT